MTDASRICRIVTLIVYLASDIVLTPFTVSQGFTHVHGVNRTNLWDFHPGYGEVDILITAFFRWFLFGMVLIHVIYNLIRNLPDSFLCKWMKWIRPGVYAILFIEGMWVGLKLLFKSDAWVEDPRINNTYWWLEFGSQIAFVVISIIVWEIFCNVAFAEEKEEHRLYIEKHGTRTLSKVCETDELCEEDMKFSSASVGLIIEYSIPDFGYLFGALIFLFIAAAGEAYLPYLLGRLVTDMIDVDRTSVNLIAQINTLLVVCTIASIAAGCRGGLFTVAMARLNMRMRDVLYANVLEQEVGWFDHVKTGDILSRLTADVTIMSDTICLNANVFFRSLVKIAIQVYLMFACSWQLTVITFILIPVITVISDIYGQYYKLLQIAVQNRIAHCNEVAEEAISSIRTVRSMAGEDLEVERYNKRLWGIYRMNIKQAWAYGAFTIFTQVFVMFLPVITIWYARLIDEQAFQKVRRDFMSFLMLQQTLGENFNQITTVYTGLMKAVGAADKVFEYILRKPKRPEWGTYIPPKGSFEGNIELKNVVLSYPSRPDRKVLNGLNIKIQTGKVTALVGPSGGGKSSTIALIENFYQPNEGEVLIDGVPVHNYDHKFIHQNIALVGQEPTLYARSVEENIRYGVEAQTGLDDVFDAAKKANAHNFITDTPSGYLTHCGEKGAQMSGGQKQRIAIARALVRKPKVLLLDEATSALDTESEHLVQQALEMNLKDRTVLVIAHRLSTVERADTIIVIQAGAAVEQGSHEELMAKPDSVYRRLVHRQLAAGEKEAEKKSSDDSTSMKSESPTKDHTPTNKHIFVPTSRLQTQPPTPIMTLGSVNASSYQPEPPANYDDHNDFVSSFRGRGGSFINQ